MYSFFVCSLKLRVDGYFRDWKGISDYLSGRWGGLDFDFVFEARNNRNELNKYKWMNLKRTAYHFEKKKNQPRLLKFCGGKMKVFLYFKRKMFVYFACLSELQQWIWDGWMSVGGGILKC